MQSFIGRFGVNNRRFIKWSDEPVGPPDPGFAVGSIHPDLHQEIYGVLLVAFGKSSESKSVLGPNRNPDYHIVGVVLGGERVDDSLH